MHASVLIRHLPFFVAAAEEENFQRASQRLNIAQSALSRRMRDLEYELGNVPLFVRMSRGVRLTPSGRILLKEAKNILEQVENARKHATSVMNGDDGTLNIGYSIGALRPQFIDDIFSSIYEIFPKISLNAVLFSVTDLQQKLRDRELDAAIFSIDNLGDEFDSLVIADEEFVLAMPAHHRLATADRILFADITDENLIWYAKILSPAATETPRAKLEAKAKAPKIVIESPSPETTLQLVSSGIGIGIIPPMPPHLLPLNVVLRPIADLALNRRFQLIWLKDNASRMLPSIISTISGKLLERREKGDCLASFS